MFKFILSVLLLLSTVFAHATTDRYHCKLSNEKDQKIFRSLRIRSYINGEMTVSFKDCSLTRDNAHFDICKLGPDTLIIGIDSTKSVLLSHRGKAIEFSCLEQDNGDGQEDPAEEEEQQEQQEQQQQQQGEPGHGGSNVRMRGIRMHEALR